MTASTFSPDELELAARAGVSPRVIAKAQLPRHRPGAKRYDFAYVEAIDTAFDSVCKRIAAQRNKELP